MLPLTPVAAELLMGCWAGEISPAADLFVGLGLCCFLSVVMLRLCVWSVSIHLRSANQIFTASPQDFLISEHLFWTINVFWEGELDEAQAQEYIVS